MIWATSRQVYLPRLQTRNLRAARTRSFRTSANGSPPSRPHCLITYNTVFGWATNHHRGRRGGCDLLKRTHVDDYSDGPGSYTLLWYVVFGDFDGVPSKDLVTLARELLERGANPNAVKEGDILMYACQGNHEPVFPMVKLLCDYGADASVKNSEGHTALSHILKDHMMYENHRDGRVGVNTDTCECVRALLRNGAQLDACYKEASAEELLDEQERRYPGLATNRHFLAIKRLVAGVRAAGGSYVRYTKKEILVLRALVRKRRATTADANQQTAFDILARSPDEIAWRILGFRRW